MFHVSKKLTSTTYTTRYNGTYVVVAQKKILFEVTADYGILAQRFDSIRFPLVNETINVF